MKVIYSPKSLKYSSAGHPESPERVKLIYQALKTDSRFEFVKAQKVSEKDLLLVHTPELIESVRKNSFWDADTPNIDGIYDYALQSVASAITTAKAAEKQMVAFSLSRPPGHHAGRNTLGGFCYFNNLAVAAAKLVKLGKRVAILDIDVHHGNGTQDIFLGKKNIIFCSIHQVPLYPGTGLISEKNCHNFPLQPETGFSKYKIELEKSLNLIQHFHADVLAVSAGFDTYKNDPLASLKLETADYYKIGQLIGKLNIPTFLILEGGYSRDIGKCTYNLLAGVTD